MSPQRRFAAFRRSDAEPCIPETRGDRATQAPHRSSLPIVLTTDVDAQGSGRLRTRRSARHEQHLQRGRERSLAAITINHHRRPHRVSPDTVVLPNTPPSCKSRKSAHRRAVRPPRLALIGAALPMVPLALHSPRVSWGPPTRGGSCLLAVARAWGRGGAVSTSQ